MHIQDDYYNYYYDDYYYYNDYYYDDYYDYGESSGAGKLFFKRILAFSWIKIGLHNLYNNYFLFKFKAITTIIIPTTIIMITTMKVRLKNI